MKNNYYNKRFLFEELDIEEQREKLEQIIVTCIDTYEKLVNKMQKYSMFQDHPEIKIISIGEVYPVYRLNGHTLKGPYDISKIRSYLNKYDEIQLLCWVEFKNNKKYWRFYDPGEFEDFLNTQIKKYQDLKLIVRDILNLAEELREYPFNYWDQNFNVQIDYTFNRGYVHLKYKFWPLSKCNETFNLEEEYPQIISKIKQIYQVGNEMLSQYYEITTQGWKDIFKKAQRINPQLYDFLTSDFVEDWNKSRK